MNNLLLIAIPTAIYVFASGLQIINLSERRLIPTFLTSLVLGGCNLAILKVVPKIETVAEGATYLIVAAVSITLSSWLYPKKTK